MKCIKEKCYFCEEHSFYKSFYRCDLLRIGFEKDSDRDCGIEKEIEFQKKSLERIKEFADFIKKNQ
jgi:hypothetical protein